jgi:hypothetical protein
MLWPLPVSRMPQPHLTIRWTQHAVRRMIEAGIEFEDVRAVVWGYDRTEEVEVGGRRIEVLMHEIPGRDHRSEKHSDDEPYVGAVYLGFPHGRPVHVVTAHQPPATIHVVTVYRPDPARWDASFQRRIT